MEGRFNSFIESLINTNSDTPTILAVSGGVDSVVMAQLFYELELPFIVAHCNFRLRGEDSNKDQEFVQKLTMKMNVEFLVKQFNTKTYADTNGVSIQMAARDLRYNWFNDLGQKHNTNIAIAHNANDVAETVLFNLAKGTGIAGLHGIAKKEKKIIRPLIWAMKDEIHAYAGKKKLEWREDDSNQSEKYMRNLVRLSVIPQFERINPSFINTMLKTTNRLKQVEESFKSFVDNLNLVQTKNDDILIRMKKLAEMKGKGAVLYYLLQPYGFNFDQAESITEALDSQGALFYSKDWILNIDRDFLILSRNVNHAIEIEINSGDGLVELDGSLLKIEIIKKEDFTLTTDSEIANLDLGKLVFPLKLRTWAEGDKFIPLGMKGNKKVSDLLIDEKVPRNQKMKQMVLLSGEDISWVVGYRINDRFKITDNTKEIYRLQLVIK